MPIKTYTCNYCGQPFQRQPSEVRVATPCCSHYCSAKLRGFGKDSKEHLKGPENAICSVCGKTFHRPPSHLARVEQPTCSRHCNGVLRGQEWAKHAHKGRAAWSPKSERALVERMTGPTNPAWRGGRIMRHHKPYIYVRCPDAYRSMARSDGYVLEHRLVMAQHLGRPLSRPEVIHHIDGNCINNRLDNLRLYKGNGPHLAVTLAKENPESPWHS